MKAETISGKISSSCRNPRTPIDLSIRTAKNQAVGTDQPREAMKFLMLMIPRVYQPDTPAAERADMELVLSDDDLKNMERMGRYNEELAKAAKMIDIDGLAPLGKGARVSFKGGTPTLTDGPFIESKEVIGGYWIFEIGSREEALEWAKRVPAEPGDVIELRPIFEFPGAPA